MMYNIIKLFIKNYKKTVKMMKKMNRSLAKNEIVRFRHKVVFKIFRYFLWFFFVFRYHFQYKKYNLNKEGPFLIIGNHSCAIDPILMAYSFNFPIYYVSSEQIFNLGWITKTLKYLVSPISKSKSLADIRTIKTIKKIINEKGSIGMFVEGNVPYNGENPHTPYAIGKLIKHLKIPVIIYNLQGLYFSNPRWSIYRKYGPTKGYIKRILFPSEIAKLTADEVYNIVIKELYVNAYQDQLKSKYRYRGKKRAEGLERFVFICPKCHQIKTLITKGHEIICLSCQAKATYLESGFLSSNDFELTTLIEWDKMQIDFYIKYLENNEILIEDKVIWWDSIINPKKKLGKAVLRLDTNGLTLKTMDKEVFYSHHQITQISIQGKHKLIVYIDDDKRWLLDGKDSFNPYQYLLTFQYYKLKNQGGNINANNYRNFFGL